MQRTAAPGGLGVRTTPRSVLRVIAELLDQSPVPAATSTGSGYCWLFCRIIDGARNHLPLAGR